MSFLIACNDVSLGYENHAIWQHLNLEIKEGDYVCILGENGSGKSTLVKGLLGLIAPLSGTIVHAPSVQGSIGYLPQQTDIQKNFPATVEEVVLSGFLNRKRFVLRYTSAMHSEALQNMGKLGVLELKNKSYKDLSGGQQQRVLLARALCAAQKLLFLDEPVSGLDPSAIKDFYKTLHYLHEKEGMTIVMVSHDVPNTMKEASHILYVRQKRQYFFGSVEEFLLTPEGKKVGGEQR